MRNNKTIDILQRYEMACMLDHQKSLAEVKAIRSSNREALKLVRKDTSKTQPPASVASSETDLEHPLNAICNTSSITGLASALIPVGCFDELSNSSKIVVIRDAAEESANAELLIAPVMTFQADVNSAAVHERLET